MAEKTLKTRIQQKHDIAANWELATNFIPKQGELIVYDIDENYSYERVKIGDGSTNVNALPFVTDECITVDLNDADAGIVPKINANQLGGIDAEAYALKSDLENLDSVVDDHINDQNNPHNVTLEQISGTLPILKGGTGGTTAFQARRNLGTANSYVIFPEIASQYNNASYGWVQTNHFASPTAANGGYGDGYYTILDSNGIFHVGTQLNQASSITWSKLYGEKNIVYSSTQPTGTKGMIWLKPV